MSFFFAHQSKIIILKGRRLFNNMSLQNKINTTDGLLGYESKFSSLKSPKYHEIFVLNLRKAKRTFLSARLNASVTVEAAIALPIFIFALISIIYLFNVLYIQLVMEIQLQNTSKLISAATCINTVYESISEDDTVDESDTEGNINDENNSFNVFSEFPEIEQVAINAAGTIAINSLFITDEIRSFANNSLIVDGADGLSFLGSDVTGTDYPLNIVLSYKVRMPFIPEDLFTFNLRHRCYFKAFNGKALRNNIDLRQIYVYVSENGEAFHINRLCSYLERYSELHNENTLRSTYPNIRLCSFCNQNSNLFSRPQINGISYVYTSTDYDVYHLSDTCIYLQRHIFRLTYDDADDVYSPCIRCVPYSDGVN